MPERGPSKAYLIALLSVMTFFWAANFIVTKFALREMPPLLITGLRMIISAAAMLPIYVWYARRGAIRWTRADLMKLIGIGLLGVGLNQVFFVAGMSRTSVAHAAIIIGLTPVTVLLLAAASGQERLKAARLAGMFLAIVGVAVVQASAVSSRTATLLGDLLVFLGSFTFAVYTVTGKAEARRLGSVTVNTFAYVASSIALLPTIFWSGSGYNWAAVTWVGWASLFYMAVIASVLCYIIYYYALSHMAASRVSTVSYIQPLLATLLAIPMLGEYPTTSLMAGGALVFAGVFVAERF